MAHPYRKQKSVAYLLWFLGCIGLCGVHRLYTERYVIGLLYLFTFGFCFLGQLIDLLLIPDDVDTFNHHLPRRPRAVPVTASRTLQPSEAPSMTSSAPSGSSISTGRTSDPLEQPGVSRRTQALLADAQASMQRLKDGG